MMKRKLPIWTFFMTLLLLFVVLYSGYLIAHCDDAKQSLETIQGSPSALTGIQLDMNTILTQNEDFLASTIQLGDSLIAKNKFCPKRSDDRDYYSPGFPVSPSIATDLLRNSKKKQGTLNYKTLSDKIPFSYRIDGSHDVIPFPYIDVDTPDNYQVTLQSDHVVDDTMHISVSTTAYATLNDTRYFSITEVYSENKIPYQITGGIFQESKDKVDVVFDYDSGSSSKNKIIDLLSLDDINCLGLVVKEEEDYLLKVVDPQTKEEKARFLLISMVDINSNILAPQIKVSYHPSTKTLTVITTAYTPHTSILKAESLYQELESSPEVFEDHTAKQDAFDQEVTTTNTFSTYRLEDMTSLLPCSTYYVPTITSQLHIGADCFTNAEDYMYHDGLLYLVTMDHSYYNGFPYLIAVKDNSVVYEGYLKTNINDDYRQNRMGIEQYNEGLPYDEGRNKLYEHYSKSIDGCKLSLAN